MSGEAIQVMVVDDNPVVRSGLVSLLEAGGETTVIAEAGDGRRAVELADRMRPDLVLLDIRMPMVDGIEAAGLLSEKTKVLMLTYTDDPETVRSAIRGGACGYLVHGAFTPEELGQAVHDAVSGRTNPLSPAAVRAMVDTVRNSSGTAAHEPDSTRASLGLSEREAEVMDLISRGYSNGDIAGELFLSEKTVKNHVNRIYARLGVDSRGAAIARWLGTTAPPGTGGAR